MRFTTALLSTLITTTLAIPTPEANVNAVSTEKENKALDTVVVHPRYGCIPSTYNCTGHEIWTCDSTGTWRPFNPCPNYCEVRDGRPFCF